MYNGVLKRSAIIGVLLSGLTPQACLAGSMGPANEIGFQDGIYNSLLLGGRFGHANWNGTSTFSSAFDFLGSQSIFETSIPRGRQNQNNFAGSFLLGYQLVRSNLYLGAEIGGTFAKDYHFKQNSSSTTTINDSSDSQVLTGTSMTQSTLTLNGSEFDIDIKPGLLVKPNFLMYGLVGAAFNSFKLTNSGVWTAQGTIAPNTYEIQFSGNSQNTINTVGTRLGVGAEYLVTKYLGLSLNYVYTNYGSATGHVSAGDEANQASSTNPNFLHANGSNDPAIAVSTQAVFAGLTYHI